MFFFFNFERVDLLIISILFITLLTVSESFFVQKTDLIAELKKTKDIPGIKKLKVQRAQVEKCQEQNLMSEITKTFSIANFVDQVSEKIKDCRKYMKIARKLSILEINKNRVLIIDS